jgi:heptosyltransferase-2
MIDIPCENVLIRGVNWVGDAVMTLPAVKAMRRALPGKKITLLVKPWVSPVFEGNPNIDGIILYDERYGGITGRFRMGGFLREKGFCYAMLLQNAFDAAFITWLAGIKERVGFGRDGRGFLLTRPIPFHGQDRKMHHIDYYLELLRRAGFDAPYSHPWIYLSLPERLKARKTLVNMKRPVIGINPGAAYGSSKRWRPERFAEVAGRVINELGGAVALFGSASEAAIADEIISALRFTPQKTDFISFAGKTTLRELAGLISECDALVSNDSGPMHMGYALKCPVVSIFGSTDPLLTGPKERGNIVIKKDVECAPCFERKCRGKAYMKCMDSITSDEVFRAVKELIPEGRAVFFDRDGTLCRDAEYLKSWDDFEASPEINDIGRLKERGFKLIGVTNQSGIARGIVEEKFAIDVNDFFVREHGFDGFYHCPHHPDEHCECRKPEPGMALRARAEHGVDLKGSYVVGDKETDMLFAKAIGAKAVFVATGKDAKSDNADFAAKGLKEAVDMIVEDSDKR